MCRCHVPMRQTHRVSRCGCRRIQRSCRAMSNPVLGQRCAQSPDARQIRDNNECRNPWHFCPRLQPEYGFLRCRCLLHDPMLLERCDLAQRLFFQVRVRCGPPYANPRTLVVMSLREPSGDQYIEDMFRLLLRGRRGRSRFYHKVSWGRSFPSSPDFCDERLVQILCRGKSAACQNCHRCTIKPPRQARTIIHVKDHFHDISHTPESSCSQVLLHSCSYGVFQLRVIEIFLNPC